MNKNTLKSMGMIVSAMLVIGSLTACGSGGGGGGSSDASLNTTVTGTVQDVNDFPIQGAQIIVQSKRRTAETDKNGKFSLKVERGKHEITIRVGSQEIYSGTFTGSSGESVSLGIIKAPFLVAFQKKMGGNLKDVGNAVIQTSDGGYVIAGTLTDNTGESDINLVKISAEGRILWDETFGGSGVDLGYSVVETSDGGYLVAGTTSSFGSNFQVYLVKTDKDGQFQWEEDFGRSGYEEGKSLRQTKDGGFIIAGSTDSFGNGTEAYLVKVNSQGGQEWDENYGGPYNDGIPDDYWAESVIQSNDEGYVVTGRTTSIGSGKTDIFILKTNADGTQPVVKALGSSEHDWGEDIQQTSDGGFIIAGMSNSFSGDIDNYDVYLVKTDSDGNRIWQRTFGSSGVDRGESVRETSDGGYVIAGVYANRDVYLIGTDNEGKLTWDKKYGGVNSDQGLSLARTRDGGYIIAGFTEVGPDDDDIYVIKTDPFGNSRE